jgi:hypothetical protein
VACGLLKKELAKATRPMLRIHVDGAAPKDWLSYDICNCETTLEAWRNEVLNQIGNHWLGNWDNDVEPFGQPF